MVVVILCLPSPRLQQIILMLGFAVVLALACISSPVAFTLACLR
jgi:hypothetical protein